MYVLCIIFLIFLGKCRYVGNIHPQVTETLLQEVFASTGPLEGCKLIRKDKVGESFFYLCHMFFLRDGESVIPWTHLFGAWAMSNYICFVLFQDYIVASYV